MYLKICIIFRVIDLINVTRAKRAHCTFSIIVFQFHVFGGLDMLLKYLKLEGTARYAGQLLALQRSSAKNLLALHLKKGPFHLIFFIFFF